MRESGRLELETVRHAIYKRWGVKPEHIAELAPTLVRMLQGTERQRASALRLYLALDQLAIEEMRVGLQYEQAEALRELHEMAMAQQAAIAELQGRGGARGLLPPLPAVVVDPAVPGAEQASGGAASSNGEECNKSIDGR